MFEQHVIYHFYLLNSRIYFSDLFAKRCKNISKPLEPEETFVKRVVVNETNHTTINNFNGSNTTSNIQILDKSVTNKEGDVNINAKNVQGGKGNTMTFMENGNTSEHDSDTDLSETDSLISDEDKTEQCTGSVTRTVDKDETVPRTVDKDETVPRTVDKDETVPKNL